MNTKIAYYDRLLKRFGEMRANQEEARKAMEELGVENVSFNGVRDMLDRQEIIIRRQRDRELKKSP